MSRRSGRGRRGRWGDAPPLRDTGSLRGDLITGLTTFCRAVERKHAVVAGLTTAIRTDPELGRLLHDQLTDPGFAEASRLIERAGTRGEPVGDVDPLTLLEVCEALVWHRLLLSGQPLDAAFVTRTVDGIVLPL